MAGRAMMMLAIKKEEVQAMIKSEKDAERIKRMKGCL